MDAKRSASSTSLSKWGLVQGWLAGGVGRRVEVRAASLGLEVRVVDPGRGEEVAEIRAVEDPSSAAWRAIIILDRDR